MLFIRKFMMYLFICSKEQYWCGDCALGSNHSCTSCSFSSLNSIWFYFS
jgi:hypothetical protein